MLANIGSDKPVVFTIDTNEAKDTKTNKLRWVRCETSLITHSLKLLILMPPTQHSNHHRFTSIPTATEDNQESFTNRLQEIRFTFLLVNLLQIAANISTWCSMLVFLVQMDLDQALTIQTDASSLVNNLSRVDQIFKD